MDRPSWDQMYMNMCYEVADRSEDESTHVGSYIVSPDNTPISFGYNGLPRGIENTPERQQRPLKYQYFEHAERNAFYNAGREGKACIGAKMYSNLLPCMPCGRAIIQEGISELIIHKQGQQAFKMSRGESVWDADHEEVLEMFEETRSIRFRWYDGPIRMGITGMWSGKTYDLSSNAPFELATGARLLWCPPSD